MAYYRRAYELFSQRKPHAVVALPKTDPDHAALRQAALSKKQALAASKTGGASDGVGVAAPKVHSLIDQSVVLFEWGQAELAFAVHLSAQPGAMEVCTRACHMTVTTAQQLT